MPLRVIHAHVELAHVNGLPEDSVLNTWTFVQADTATSTPGELTTQLATFYDTLSDYISPQVSRVALTSKIRLYDITTKMEGGPMGAPFFEDSFTPNEPLSGTPLPAEVACVLTLTGEGRSTAAVEVADNAGLDPDDADTTVDRPMQRRTGRVYLGPLTGSALGTDGRFSGTFTAIVVGAMEAMGSALSLDGFTTAVWSRKNGAVYELENAWVDNAPDTIRSRGVKPTARVWMF